MELNNENREKIMKALTIPRNNVIVKVLESKGADFSHKGNFVKDLATFIQSKPNFIQDYVSFKLNEKGNVVMKKSDVENVLLGLQKEKFYPKSENFRLSFTNETVIKDIKVTMTQFFKENNRPDLNGELYNMLKFEDKLLLSFGVALSNENSSKVPYIMETMKRIISEIPQTNSDVPLRNTLESSKGKTLFENNVVEFDYENLNGTTIRMLATRNKDVIEQMEILRKKEDYREVTFKGGDSEESFMVYDLNSMNSINPFKKVIVDRISYISDLGTPTIATFDANSTKWFDRLGTKEPLKLDGNSQIGENGVITGDATSKNYPKIVKEISKYRKDGNSSDEENKEDSKKTEQIAEMKDKLRLIGAKRSNVIVIYMKNKYGLDIKLIGNFAKLMATYFTSNLDKLNILELSENKTYFKHDSIEKLIETDPEFVNLIKNYEKTSIKELPEQIQSGIRETYLWAFDKFEEEYGENLYVRADYPVRDDMTYILNMNELYKIYLDSFELPSEQLKQKLIIKILSDVKSSFTNVTDGRLIEPEEFHSMLRKYVVVIKYVGSNLNSRTMIGTMNPQILEHFNYLKNGEKMIENMENNVEEEPKHPQTEERITFNSGMRILDLELVDTPNAFRQVRMDRISKDSTNYPNVMFIEPNDHVWYLLSKDSSKLQNYANRLLADNEVVFRNSGVKSEDYIKEQQDVESIKDRLYGEEEPLTEEEQLEEQARIRTFSEVKKALGTIKQYTRYDEELFNKITSYARQNFPIVPNVMNEEENLVISAIYGKQYLMILQSEGVSYYVNPYFMVSDLGYKVFKDRTETIDLGRRALTQPSDIRHKKHLLTFAKMVSKRREGLDTKMTTLRGSDKKRFARLEKFGQQETLEHYEIGNLQTRYINAGEHSHLRINFKGLDNKNHVFMLSPIMLADGNTGQMYHRLRSGESHLSGFEESFKMFKGKLPEDVFKEIYIIAQNTLDLRRSMEV